MLFNAQEFQALVEPGNRLIGCICSQCGKKYHRFEWSDVCTSCLKTIYIEVIQDENRPLHQHA